MASTEQVRSLIDRIHQLNRFAGAAAPEAFATAGLGPGVQEMSGVQVCRIDDPGLPGPQPAVQQAAATALPDEPAEDTGPEQAPRLVIRQNASAPFTGVMPDAETLQGWPHVVCNISLNPGHGFYFFETAAAGPVSPATQAAKYMITGHVGAGRFRVLVEKDFVDSILSDHDVNASTLSEDPLDRAMVFELFCLDLIERMEARTGDEVQFDEVQVTSSEPAEGWLYLNCPALDRTPLIAIATDGRLAPVLKQFVAANRAPREHQYSNELSVSIGPVALPLGDCLALGAGDLLDCGFDPSGEVYGMLVRSDGCFWPVSIEGSLITVTGELQQPLPAPHAEVADAVFQLGVLHLQHCVRRTIAPGMSFAFNQNEDGRTTMWLGPRKHATGAFEVHDESLFVLIDAVEERSW